MINSPVQAQGDGTAFNPLREGLPSDRITDPCTIVFFGASGDLFKRMLLPAVYSMRLHGTLPTDFALVGFARTAYTDDEFREYCRQQLETFMPADRRPPALMMSLHIWALSHGIASLFARGDAGRRALPMPAEELLEAGVLVYLRGLGLIAEPNGAD